MKAHTALEKGGFWSPFHSSIWSYIRVTLCIIAGVATALNGASSSCHSR